MCGALLSSSVTFYVNLALVASFRGGAHWRVLCNSHAAKRISPCCVLYNIRDEDFMMMACAQNIILRIGDGLAVKVPCSLRGVGLFVLRRRSLESGGHVMINFYCSVGKDAHRKWVTVLGPAVDPVAARPAGASYSVDQNIHNFPSTSRPCPQHILRPSYVQNPRHLPLWRQRSRICIL